jgi:arabinofuranan 3-O-arabinosyltransferase
VRTRIVERSSATTAATTRARRRPTARQVMWALLALAFLSLPFLSAPGRFFFDTRDPAWFNPTTYLARSVSLWRAVPYLGQEQHDGILVPMAVVVWMFRSVGFPIWVAERLWHGFLLFATVGSTILLVDGLRGRRTVIAPLTAGLAYTLTPYTIGYGLPFTPVFLPYVLLPLLLLVAFRGAGEHGLMWPAAFGLITFLMGGGNGAPQMYVLMAAWTLIAWQVFARKTVSVRRGISFVAWSFAFFVGLNAWWLFLLSSPEVFNALKFSEQPPVINITSSPAEAFRGLGFWAFYGGDQFGSWVVPVRAYITSPILILTGFAIPIGALVSAWLVRWSHRLYFLLLATVAVFVSVGIFPVRSPSPFGRVLSLAYAHVTGVVGLRTTYKVTAEVNLALALLAGVGLEQLWIRLRTARRSTLLRWLVLATVVAVIGANGYPLWTGRLYNPARGVAGVPVYWQQALASLDERDSEYRAFFAPATYWTTYTWGSIKESVVATDPNVNAAYPLRLPIAQRYGSNLVAAIEEPYLDGASAKGTAQLMRYLGVQDVVLQNDLDWQRSHTASPAELQILRDDPDLRPTLEFGLPGENVDVGGSTTASLGEPPTPVEVLTVADAVPMVRAEEPFPIVVSGDGYGIASAARQGLLPEGVPLLYSGTLTPQALQNVLTEGRTSFLVTDSNRREAWYFAGPRAPHSYTLAAGQSIPGHPNGYLLFGDRSATQSVAEYPGLRRITASGYGAVFGTSAQYRPSNAFDGDPNTWWVVGNGSTPASAWIEADLAAPARVASISIGQPDAWWLREIREIRLTFSDGSSVLGTVARGKDLTITFPPRTTTSIRVTVDQIGGNPLSGRRSGSAISDISIPGIDATETIRAPMDLFDDAKQIPDGMEQLAAAPFTYVFQRARSYYPGGPDEEVRIDRRFEVAGTRTLVLGGKVGLNRAASDAQLDGVLLGSRDVTVTASSRLLGNPAFRGSAALDGDPSTAWLASAAPGRSIDIRFPAHTIDRIVVDTAVGSGRDPIARMRAVFPDGSVAYGDIVDPIKGVVAIRFPARSVSGVTLVVDTFASAAGAKPGAIGISEVHIDGVPPLRLSPNAQVPCSDGVAKLDGAPISVRAEGTVQDLLGGASLPLATCDGSGLAFTSGWHHLVAGGGLQPNAITLTGPSRSANGGSAALPTVSATRSADGGFDVRIGKAQGPYFLVTGQNWDPHWVASIDGTRLGPPTLVDGYSAGWRIDRPGSYVVTVRYGKQRLYVFALAVSGLTLIVAVAAITVGRQRRRRRVPRQ